MCKEKTPNGIEHKLICFFPFYRCEYVIKDYKTGRFIFNYLEISFEDIKEEAYNMKYNDEHNIEVK